MKRRIKLFGRSIPLATVLAVIVIPTMIVGAWAAVTFMSQVSVTTAPLEVDFEPQGSWVCNLANGTGATLTKCAATGSGGLDMAVSGLSEDDLNVWGSRNFKNVSGGPACIGLTYTPTVPAGLELAVATVGPIANNDEGLVEIILQSNGIGPSQSLTIPNIEVGMVSCP